MSACLTLFPLVAVFWALQATHVVSCCEEGKGCSPEPKTRGIVHRDSVLLHHSPCHTKHFGQTHSLTSSTPKHLPCCAKHADDPVSCLSYESTCQKVMLEGDGCWVAWSMAQLKLGLAWSWLARGGFGMHDAQACRQQALWLGLTPEAWHVTNPKLEHDLSWAGRVSPRKLAC